MNLKYPLLLLVFVVGLATDASAQTSLGVPLKEATEVTGYPAKQTWLEQYGDSDSAMRFIYLTAAANALGSKEYEKSDQAMMGVHVRPADETLRKHLRIKGNFGLVVEHVIEQSAAEKFELDKHDVLYKLDGQLLANSEQFQSLIDSYKPGDKVLVEFYRAGNVEKLEVELTEKKVDSISLKNLEEYHKSLLDNANPHVKNWQIHDCKTCHSVDRVDTLNSSTAAPGQRLPMLIKSRMYPSYKGDDPKNSKER